MGNAWESINAKNFFNVNVRVGDTMHQFDGWKQVFPKPIVFTVFKNISTPYYLNEERHSRRERYGLQIVEFGKYFQHDL